MTLPSGPPQVEEHVRFTYVSLLPARLALLRRLHVERRWLKLRLETEKLALGAEKHGLHALAGTARTVVKGVPVDLEPLTFSLPEESRIALGALLHHAG